MMKYLTSLLNWYATKTKYAIGLMFVIQIIQIPHMIWAGDAILQSGYVFQSNQIMDWVLYGIDLIEIPALLNATVLFANVLRNKHA